MSQSTDDSRLLNAQDWNKYFQITEVKVCVIMKQLTRLTYWLRKSNLGSIPLKITKLKKTQYQLIRSIFTHVIQSQLHVQFLRKIPCKLSNHQIFIHMKSENLLKVSNYEQKLLKSRKHFSTLASVSIIGCWLQTLETQCSHTGRKWI